MFTQVEGTTNLVPVCDCPGTANGFLTAGRRIEKVDVSYVNCKSGQKVIGNLRRNGRI